MALGSANIELDLRVRLMKTACNQLRLNRFFLMAIELKEKEKNLLMQSFAYGDDQSREEAKGGQFAAQANQPVSTISIISNHKFCA